MHDIENNRPQINQSPSDLYITLFTPVLDGKMKTFDVYKHPAQGYQAVKRGFSWPTFFLSIFNLIFIWAFLKRMWVFGFACFGIYMAVYYMMTFLSKTELLEEYNGSLIGLCLIVVFSIITGFTANDWRKRNLIKRGYEQMRTVEAGAPAAAITKVEQMQVLVNM